MNLNKLYLQALEYLCSIKGITLFAVYANVYDGSNASEMKDQKELCECSHLGPSHALTLILPFWQGKEKPSQFLTKVFLLLASISFSDLNTWWFENRKLRAPLLRHSPAHPGGYLTEDVGTELTQNSRTSLLLHKGLPRREQCCSFRILIKRARSHVKGGFLHADIMGNFYVPLYHFSKVNIIRSCK